MVQVKLEEVTKRFGNVTAVENASFTAREGKLLSLVGPSGCGKTTILRLIAGFENPDGGDIKFDNASVLNKAPESRNVGMVFQNYALFPHMNVFNNIAYGLRFSGMSRMEKSGKIGDLLKLVNLEGMEKRNPGELSAGQQQRVALARALAVEPALLLLDEPLSALDAKLRERLRMDIKRIQQTLNITTVYVTHDQEEALVISDEVAVMNEGRIQQVGKPQELYNHPNTEFVADFVGRGNLISGQIVDILEDYLTVEIDAKQVRISIPLTENKGPYKIGEAVKFLVRPEKVKVDDSLANKLQVTLKSIEYLGDAYRAHLEYQDKELIAKVSDKRFPPVNPEEDLTVSFSPDDCYLVSKG